jgi:predicted transcriptional regulator
MDAALLIDAIVRQTTVLIATLATTSGQRAQLAHVANRVFADLVNELRAQGLGNKVIADMFGIALRTYHRRLGRMSASRTERGQSLWESVLRHIQQAGPLSRAQILHHFHRDDDVIVRSILLDLADTGLVSFDGRDEAAIFSATEVGAPAGAHAEAASLEAMVLVALHRGGPLTPAQLAEVVPAAAEELQSALGELVRSGLATQSADGQRYGSRECVIDFGDAAGWEAAVFDHYQAMVSALVSKLRSGRRRSDLDDAAGGSTFVYDLWRGHPRLRKKWS